MQDGVKDDSRDERGGRIQKFESEATVISAEWLDGQSRHRKRQWDQRNSPCSIPPKGRRLQASFNRRVWTTAWAGWGRIHTSPLTRKAPLHQTGFSSWLELLSTCQATTGKQRGCLNSHLGGIFLTNTFMKKKSQCSSFGSLPFPESHYCLQNPCIFFCFVLKANLLSLLWEQ